MKFRIAALGFTIATIFSSCSRETILMSSNSGGYGAYYKPEKVAAAQSETAPEAAAEEMVLTAAAATAPAQFNQVPSFTAPKNAKAAVKQTAANTAADKAPAPAAKKEEKATEKDSEKAKSTKNSGKSQLVAALLCAFGWFGVQRFYLGYTGLGIAQLALFFTGIFLVIPLFALAVWLGIDFVRILTGSLQPKNGTYDQTI